MIVDDPSKQESACPIPSLPRAARSDLYSRIRNRARHLLSANQAALACNLRPYVHRPGGFRPQMSPDHSLNPDASPAALTDRKSTRLNSSHVEISYAVFCLKKKKRL